MVAGLAIRDPDGRPRLTRSRSHTTPSSTAVPKQAEETATAAGPRSPPRPSHGRSHSYLSPVEAKPRNAQTLPAETTKHSHTLRLPGTHREHKHHLRHRHTQSEAKHSKPEPTDNLPHLVSRLQKERISAEKHGSLSRQGTNTSTSTWQSHVNNIVRIASTDPYRNMNPTGDAPGPAFGPAYLRAYDGPYARQPTTKRQTWIELAIDRAEAKKELERRNPKPLELEKRQAELANAQDELRDTLADVGQQSGEIGRRLEYTYYSLLEKMGSLLGTIQSFQVLSGQSRQLIRDFEAETAKLDGDIQRPVEKLRAGFDERDERVRDLEERSVKAGTKAQQLQTRLQNARTILENWERREEAAAKKWFRVWGYILWGSLILFTSIMSIVVYNEWYFQGSAVYAGLGTRPLTIDTRPGNHSLAINIPEEVRVVLEGIEERQRIGKKVFPPLPERVEVYDEKVERKRDKRLRVLDEL